MTSRIVIAYLCTLATFCVLDFLWLGVVAKPLYQAEVGSLMLERPNFAAAAVLYVLLAAGLVYFAVIPGVDAGSFWRAVARGALLGLVVYGVYDLTNLAVLKGWTVAVTAADVAWGIVVCGASTAAGYAAARLAGSTI